MGRRGYWLPEEGFRYNGQESAERWQYSATENHGKEPANEGDSLKGNRLRGRGVYDMNTTDLPDTGLEACYCRLSLYVITATHRTCRVIDADLVAAARQGDAAAWETLVRQHQTPVFRLAYLIVGDAHAAEDIAQETFLRAFRSLHRFDAARPLRPWLLQIATRLAYNQRRSAGRYFAALQRLFQSTPASAVRQEAHVAHEESNTLWQAIRCLGRADQEIIYMRYYLELSEVETAAALGIAQGTVKSRLHRATQRLRMVVESSFPHLQREVKGEPTPD